MTGLIIGAYPIYAASDDDAAACVQALAERPDVSGLELPMTGHGIVVPRGCPDRWRHVVTLVGDTMVRMRAEPTVGLASLDAEGRRAAVRAVAEAREAIIRLTASNVDGGSVRAIEIHSAPTQHGSGEALAESLTEIAVWDWQDCEVWLEHCDRWRDDQPVQKGFLSLPDELEVLAGLSGRVGVCINWARSVIETRDVSTAAEHVRAAVGAGLLRGVFFSSVADADSAYGAAWADAHLPPRGSSGSPESSLLDEALIAASVAAADGQAVLGLKIGVQPSDQPIEARVAHLVDAVERTSAATGLT